MLSFARIPFQKEGWFDMFGKKTRTTLKATATDTLIGEGTVFTGQLRSAAGIRIEGQVIGDIESEGEVTIGEKGVARSQITAKDIIIAGHLHGKATASGLLTITSTGKLNGSVRAVTLVIDPGAAFEGSCEMLPQGTASPTAASAALAELAQPTAPADAAAGKRRQEPPSERKPSAAAVTAVSAADEPAVFTELEDAPARHKHAII
jgi:cytoskeletal protein CcmA (bactofilin family)